MTHAPAGRGKSIRNVVESSDRAESAVSNAVNDKTNGLDAVGEKDKEPGHDFETVPEKEGIWREQ